MAHDFGLLVDFLRHEVLVVALVDQGRGCGGLHRVALDHHTFFIADLDALVRHHRPIAVVEIGDRVGERRERDGIRAQIHLAVAVADRERRAFAGPDHEIVLARKQESECECAAQLPERGLDRLDRRLALAHFLGDQMNDHFGVGFAAELRTVLAERFAQLAEIFDNAVVHDGDALGGVRMRIEFGRLAVGRPAGVSDAHRTGERLTGEALLQVLELALRAPARQRASLQCRHACGIVAAILQALERIDELSRDGFTPENSNDPAQSGLYPLAATGARRCLSAAARSAEIKMHVRM